MPTYTFRLTPGQDLKLGIEAFVQEKGLQAAVVVTCVGGLSQTRLRMAGAAPDKQDIRERTGHYEIVSLVGTISQAGSHLHLAVSDTEGLVSGGHLKEGSLVYPTAEVVIHESAHELYGREPDAATGFDELVVTPR